LLIKGVPQKEDEDLVELVTRTATILGVAGVRCLDAHRLSHTTQGYNIVAVMEAKHHKNEMIMKRIVRGELKVSELEIEGHYNNDPMITVTEHLCPTIDFLFRRAKANCKQLGYIQCFTTNGKIFFRKVEKGPKTLIASHDELNDFLLQAGKADAY